MKDQDLPKKIAYLRALHDIAYQANMADSLDRRAKWQKARMASDHVNACTNMVRDVLDNDSHYGAFLDYFGDFDAFVAECLTDKE